MIEFDRVKKNLDDLKNHGLASHPQLETTGRERGIKSQPLKSHKGLDIVELQVHNKMKSLHIDTMSAYKDAITLERQKVHPNLIKIELNSEENADLDYDLPTETPKIIFSDIIESRRSTLLEMGNKAFDSLNNLTQFKEKNDLGREAEYPDNRTNYFLMIGGVILVVGILMFGLLSSQDSDSTFMGIIATVLLVSAFNTVSGIISSECLRAFYHKADALRLTSKTIFFVLGISTILFNLGIGHYRDALDPDYPTESTSETTNVETPQTDILDSITSTPREGVSNGISIETNSPSEQAITLLFRKFLLLNELHSYFLTILGIILLAATMWLAWKSDDEYFQYGEKTRHHNRSITEWNAEHETIINNLKTQYNRIHENLQASRINFVDMREMVITNYDNFSTQANQLIMEIENACIDSICVYRTANIEVRPKLTPAPSHWDENWRPGWDKFITSSTDFLCSQEEALIITQQRDQEISNQITDLEEIYQNYIDQVSSFGPITKKS
ncbi:MAG: hypothetical protein OXF84_00160 [Bacteroidetes bacterium]|nr:hypothetical protein [Bacteroidota bacterium]